MGFRFRKSINLGGGFKINLSKSGIGYSWGVKGYRVTKTARGTVRRTASIPGTGISFVDETSRKKFNSDGQGGLPYVSPGSPDIDNNHYDTKDIVNNVATALVSDGLEEMLSMASRVMKLDRISNIGLIITLIFGCGLPMLFVVSCVFLILKIYVRTNGKIMLDYSIDEDQQTEVNEHMNPMLRMTECSKTWRIMQTSRVIDKKYAAGADNTVRRINCKSTTRPPFPFTANIKIASFKTGKETLLFCPDKLFVIQGNKIGALSYKDVCCSVKKTRFIEEQGVPCDSQIVDYTWKYVNKSGGPDRRFRDNRKLPICLYGECKLTSISGLNTVIMFSNPNLCNS